MDIELRKELKSIVMNNLKIIQAIEDDKNINIKKSIKACCISITRISKVMLEYLVDPDFDYEDSYEEYRNSKNDDKSVDDLMNMFGIKK